MTPLKVILCLTLIFQCNCFIPGSSHIGTTFSALSLALSVPHYFIFKTHLRILDFLQITHLFNLINLFSSVYPTFSSSLGDSWLKFMPNFYSKVCEVGGYICTAGYALSAATVLLGIVLLAMFITGVEKCRKPQKIQFGAVFTLFKGFLRWVYISLVSVSTLYVYYYATGAIPGEASNFILPIIIGSVCFVYPFAQLISSKCSQTPQTQDLKAKWVEFLGLLRLLLLAILVSVQSVATDNGLGLIYIGSFIVLIGYAVGYSLLFKFEIIQERVLVGVEEAILVTLFALYIFKVDKVSEMDLDFYLVTVVFVLELMFEIYSWVTFIKKSKELASEVLPLDSKGSTKVKSIDESQDVIVLPPKTRRLQLQAQQLQPQPPSATTRKKRSQ